MSELCPTRLTFIIRDLGHGGAQRQLVTLAGALAGLVQRPIALSKKFLPCNQAHGLLSRVGAKTVVAATLRAVQLLGRQFVLGQNITEAMREADDARRRTANLRFATHGPSTASGGTTAFTRLPSACGM